PPAPGPTLFPYTPSSDLVADDGVDGRPVRPAGGERPGDERPPLLVAARAPIAADEEETGQPGCGDEVAQAGQEQPLGQVAPRAQDRKSTRLNSSHVKISY